MISSQMIFPLWLLLLTLSLFMQNRGKSIFFWFWPYSPLLFHCQRAYLHRSVNQFDGLFPFMLAEWLMLSLSTHFPSSHCLWLRYGWTFPVNNCLLKLFTIYGSMQFLSSEFLRYFWGAFCQKILTCWRFARWQTVQARSYPYSFWDEMQTHSMETFLSIKYFLRSNFTLRIA